MGPWWIDEPTLLGSSNPSTPDLKRLRAEGFQVLVSLLCEHKQAPNYAHANALGYEKHNIPVEDFHAPTVEQLKEFVALLNRLPPGTKAVVHCQGGSGRTGTFAAAYWVAKGMAVADAIVKVRKAKAGAIETGEQEAALEQFARDRGRVAS